MEKFRNSAYVAFFAACVASTIGFLITIVFIYSKNPLELDNAMVALLTIVPFIFFFIVTIIIIPIVTIPIRRKILIRQEPLLKGIYEIFLYVFFCSILTIMFDFFYRYITGNKFAENFALALKYALNNTNNDFSAQDYKYFSVLPFLVQNFFTLVMGMLVASSISYPISIAISKRTLVVNKNTDYGRH